MSEIIEGRLKLRFPPGWQTLKYDDCAWHKESRAGNGAHAMDILATDEENNHWWVEIKDCEGFEAENRPRLADNSPPSLIEARSWLVDQEYERELRVTRSKPYIVDEMLLKVRDTLAALAIAHRLSEDSLQSWNLFIPPAPNWKVVLLLTWEDKAFKMVAKRLQTKLERAFRYYGLKVFVVNQHTLAACGLRCTLSRVH